MTDALLPEFDHEMAVTRRVLERVPMADGAWKPHEKSMSLGGLATHLANIPSWTAAILRNDSYDMGGDNGERMVPFGDQASLLAHFDEATRGARELLAQAPDAELLVPWTLKKEGQVVFTVPRVACLRSFLFSHMIHHRGQMSVYLRLRDVPVPSIYGPSADER
jgi:uncharacterized damage-inducible protein DinB